MLLHLPVQRLILRHDDVVLAPLNVRPRPHLVEVVEHEAVFDEILDVVVLLWVVVEFVLSGRDGAAVLRGEDLEAVALPVNELVVALLDGLALPTAEGRGGVC